MSLLQNQINIYVNANGELVPGSAPTNFLYRNSLNRNVFFIVTPLSEAAVVKLIFKNTSLAKQGYTDVALPTQQKGSNITNENASYYDTVKDWNVFKCIPNETILAKFPSTVTGTIALTVSIKEPDLSDTTLYTFVKDIYTNDTASIEALTNGQYVRCASAQVITAYGTMYVGDKLVNKNGTKIIIHAIWSSSTTEPLEFVGNPALEDNDYEDVVVGDTSLLDSIISTLANQSLSITQLQSYLSEILLGNTKGTGLIHVVEIVPNDTSTIPPGAIYLVRSPNVYNSNIYDFKFYTWTGSKWLPKDALSYLGGITLQAQIDAIPNGTYFVLKMDSSFIDPEIISQFNNSPAILIKTYDTLTCVITSYYCYIYNHAKHTWTTMPLIAEKNVTQGGWKLITSGGVYNAVKSVQDNVDKVVDGTTQVGKAVQDQNGDVIDTTYQKVAEKGIAGGYAPLNASGKIPDSYLPIDTTPTINSTNFITSGAVYNEQTSRENADTTLQNNITTLNVYTDDTKATKIQAEYYYDTGMMIMNLKNKAGTIISTTLVDLPLELIVVSGSYDSATQELVLVLANGSEIRIPVASMLTNVVQTTNGLVANNLVKATDTHNVEDSGIAFSEVADKTYVGSKIGSIHKIDFNATRSGTILTGNATAYALSDLVVGNLYSIDISYAISGAVVDSDSVVLKLSDGISVNIYNPLNTSGICKVGDLKQVQFPYSTQTGHRWIFHALLVKTGTNYFFGIVPSVSQQSILAVDNNFLLNVSGESIDLFPYNDGQLFYCIDDGGYEMGHTYKANFNYVSNLVVLSDITVEVPNIMISITHADLLAKVEAGTLIAGQQYRITDYNCSTSTINTQSAGHQFDIIVMADDEKTLNENARAILHDGDTYFANAKLSAWKLKYSIVNDTTRFAWADEVNGKGVIYQMIDEWNNECPYDFKNIQFIRKLTDGVLDLVGGVDTWVYTFNAYNTDNSNILDGSLLNGLYQIDDADIMCKNNMIKSYNQEGMHSAVIRKQELNDIVFLNTYSLDNPHYFECYSNSFKNGCRSNTFGNTCSFNTFGNSCSSNTFGTNCFMNTFGNSCSSNTFGNGCSSNTFGTSCYMNTFGNSCYMNTFGTKCYNNTFGTNCSRNTFGAECSSNAFGTYCSRNIFGTSCYNNTFETSCYMNTFGTNCFMNTFGAECYNNIFGNGCQYDKITGGSVRYLNLDNGIQGASAVNKLELYDLEIVNKEYQISFKKSASGRYLMLWATDTGAMTGKYKALNTDETWTAL